MGFKENLKEEIEYQGFTLKELSYLSGIPKGSLSNYLKENSSIPSADVAVKIASALNTSVEYLVNGKINTSGEKHYPADIRIMADMISTMTAEKKEIIKNLIEGLAKLS